MSETGYKEYPLKDVKDSADRKLFTVVSTFAGGGGSSTGYKLAGGHVLAMNEFQEIACKTYSANYPDIDKYQSFMDQWVRLVPSINRHAIFFEDLNDRETLYRG